MSLTRKQVREELENIISEKRGEIPAVRAAMKNEEWVNNKISQKQTVASGKKEPNPHPSGENKTGKTYGPY